MTLDLTMIFLFGLSVGFGHCIGMCGGFVMTYSLKIQKQQGKTPIVQLVAPHLLYSAGRILTYSFLGGLFGIIGLTFDLFNFQSYLQILAGIVMIILAAELAGWIPHFSNVGFSLFKPFRTVAGHLMSDLTLTNVFITGLILGFLPCGPVYVAVTKSIAAGSIPYAMLTMIVYGLGTVPALLLVGLGANFVSGRIRFRLFRLSAILVLLLGSYTLYKGWVKLQMPTEMIQKKIEMMHRSSGAPETLHNEP
ncbi:MAG: sulfite exporter TauE/SafE family protein [FCB group bacterium]|nr:sulfite exporter TauE/SafE family protein [FCB group bacterium]